MSCQVYLTNYFLYLLEAFKVTKSWKIMEKEFDFVPHPLTFITPASREHELKPSLYQKQNLSENIENNFDISFCQKNNSGKSTCYYKICTNILNMINKNNNGFPQCVQNILCRSYCLCDVVCIYVILILGYILILNSLVKTHINNKLNNGKIKNCILKKQKHIPARHLKGLIYMFYKHANI